MKMHFISLHGYKTSQFEEGISDLFGETTTFSFTYNHVRKKSLQTHVHCKTQVSDPQNI